MVLVATGANAASYNNNQFVYDSLGNQLMTARVSGNLLALYVSTDSGTSWSLVDGDMWTTTQCNEHQIFMTPDDVLFIVGMDDSNNAIHTAFDWNASTQTPTARGTKRVHAMGGAKTSSALEVVKIGNDYHTLWFFFVTNNAYQRMFSKLDGANTWSGTTILQFDASNSLSMPFAARSTLAHTGDGKTPSGTQTVWVAWNNNQFSSCRLKRWFWDGSSWTEGSQTVLFSGSSNVQATPMWRADTNEVYVGFIVGNAFYVRKRDAADLTTTDLTPSPTIINAALSGYAYGMKDGGIITIFFITSGTGRYRRWDPASPATLTAEVQFDSGVLTHGVPTHHTHKRLVPVAYSKGSTDAHAFILEVLNAPPTAPTVDAPPDGSTQDVAEQLLIDWTFNDPDVGDTQSAYTVRKREGAGAFEYWNGTTWQASEDASTKQVTTLTALQLDGGWGADLDDDHFYSVKTWDAADDGPSAWSSEVRVIPSAQDVPTITYPVADDDTVGASETVTWTMAGVQTKQHVRILGDNAGSPDLGNVITDYGIMITGTKSQAVTFQTTGTTRHIELTTWNAEGLQLDGSVYRRVSVVFVPPSTPTLVAQSEVPADAITVTIDNPGGGEPVTNNDLRRRVVGETSYVTLATNLAVDAVFIDYTPVSQVVYEYQVVARAANGTTAESAWTA